ncbi:MAG TPA: hypothetical protein DCW31_01545 [Lactobacillus sp.]|nr:hypothetical protein [Lactobacillus sp.]
MLTTAALDEIVNGLWLDVTMLMNEVNRLKKHSRQQMDYDAIMAEKVTPHVSAIVEVIAWLPNDLLSDSGREQLTAVVQAVSQIQKDQHRKLDVDLLRKRNLDREEGRISRHRHFW